MTLAPQPARAPSPVALWRPAAGAPATLPAQSIHQNEPHARVRVFEALMGWRDPTAPELGGRAAGGPDTRQLGGGGDGGPDTCLGAERGGRAARRLSSRPLSGRKLAFLVALLGWLMPAPRRRRVAEEAQKGCKEVRKGRGCVEGPRLGRLGGSEAAVEKPPRRVLLPAEDVPRIIKLLLARRLIPPRLGSPDASAVLSSVASRLLELTDPRDVDGDDLVPGGVAG